jgi:hypothetical protein
MKIVIGKLEKTTAREVTSKGSSVKLKRARGADGKTESVYVVDLASKTVDRDLTYVFGRNVAKARAENKKLLGSSDGCSIKR